LIIEANNKTGLAKKVYRLIEGENFIK